MQAAAARADEGWSVPGVAEAQFQRGRALHEAGRFEPAIAAYGVAIQFDRAHGEAHHWLGLALLAMHRIDGAIEAFEVAIRLRPDAADSLVALAEALLDAGRPQEAIGVLAPACRRHPDHASLLTLTGVALLDLGRPRDAAGALSLALTLQPDDAAAHGRLASALFQAGDKAEALTHRTRAFRLTPDHLTATNLSSTLLATEHHEAALALAEHALDLHDGDLEPLAVRFLALQELGRFDEALVAGRQALTAWPQDARVQHDLAALLLGLGELTTEAWTLYEARLHAGKHPARCPSAVPRWTGEDIAGQTILLYAEQGLGDTLQFVRYAPMVAEHAAQVILAVQRPLLRLLRQVAGVDHVIALDDPMPAADVACPLLSLPGVFGTTLDSIPPQLPYADSFPPAGRASAGLHVGLVWTGNANFIADAKRSIDGARLAVLAGIPGVRFHSLQLDPATMSALPPALGVNDLMAGVQDFADTASRVAGLDLVIAVDTAVAHLAATLGKPVWLLSRFHGCWRWLHNRADSPWYPSLRIFRQDRPNDWTVALSQVREALLEMAAALPR